MSASLISGILIAYFLLLIVVSYFTSKNASTDDFFTAKKSSPWYLVAFGMIGTSISGATFISVPGKVSLSQFSYYQVVIGQFTGLLVVIYVLLPLYYRLNLISIYTYLEKRFGKFSYKTGSMFFIVSRTLGASIRLFLAAKVLQDFIFEQFNVPFYVTVLITILLIWVYTIKGGIKTIIWTDSLQTLFLITALVVSIIFLSHELHLGTTGLVTEVYKSNYSKIFFFDDIKAKNYFFKNFISGLFLAIAMIGLDQDLMQKNLTCKDYSEARKNMLVFSFIMLFVNLLFLSLGALLYMYIDVNHISLNITDTDDMYPNMALKYLGSVTAICFLLGITASSYASSDSALASLTTAFCIDFLNFSSKSEEVKKTQKLWVHIGFSILFFIVILVYRAYSNKAVIDALFTIAGYTYGPLLGMFSFGILTKRNTQDKLIPIFSLISPAVTYGIFYYVEKYKDLYKFSFELLVINAFIMFVLMFVVSKKTHKKAF
ncbi:MAG: sodium:solute symporter [Cytophagales bacterium]